jgi:phosphonate transport system substrate-binding protein
MMSGTALGRVAALLLAGLSLLGCGRSEGEIGTPGTPVILLLSPAHAARATPEDRAALGALLTKESGLAVEVRAAASAAEAIDAFRSARGADVGLLNLFEYLLARAEYGAEAGLQVLRGAGETEYAGEILVRADGPVAAVKDLAGKRLAYVDAYSTSGYALPAQLLAAAGVAVSPEFAGSPERALSMLREGKVDAAAVYRGAAAKDPALRVIATTETVPNEPVFFRKGLDPEKKTKLVEALKRAAATPEGRRLLSGIADISGFRDAAAAGYDSAAALVQASGRDIRDLVERGWDVNRPAVVLEQP